MVIERGWNHGPLAVLSAGIHHEAFEMFTFMAVLRQTISIQSTMFFPAENHIRYRAMRKESGDMLAGPLAWSWVRHGTASSEEATDDLAV
ncbi:MAG TPA: hypothetical protein VN229_12715 [Terriglobales bacterium]|nr:hypothetical protein [Terriglobales bacterium]